MTPAQRRDLAYAPELAVIHALRAAAEATCAALAAEHHLDREHFPASREQVLACRLCAVLDGLVIATAAYCDHIAELARTSAKENDDIAF